MIAIIVVVPTGTVTFKRQLLKEFPKWDQSNRQLTRVHVSSQGTIEDDGIGMLQVCIEQRFFPEHKIMTFLWCGLLSVRTCSITGLTSARENKSVETIIQVASFLC